MSVLLLLCDCLGVATAVIFYVYVNLSMIFFASGLLPLKGVDKSIKDTNFPDGG